MSFFVLYSLYFTYNPFISLYFTFFLFHFFFNFTTQGSHWELSVRSSKICKLKWGRVQGKEALLGHFLGTMHLNDTPCGFKPVTIEIDESTGTTIVQEVV